MRNPLLSIGLNAELIEEELREAGDRPEATHLAGAIHGEVQRLKTITEGYLQYARLPKPDRSQFALSGLIEEMMVFLAGELTESEVTWSVDADDKGVRVEADAAQLRTALLNVARNAVEAMRKTSRPKRLDIALKTVASQRAEIWVTDTGPGIASDLADQIFEPFVTSKDSGTGLGLALTREIIHSHGGEIHVHTPAFSEDEPAYGTSFVISIPTV